MSGNTILKLALRGIRREQTQSQCRTPRLPITQQILADLLEHLGCNSTIPSQGRLMLKAAMSLPFFGFLRVSEFTVPAYHTPRRDIQFLGHRLKVFLTHSKKDQFGQGSVITVGSSEDACCPPQYHATHYLESCRTPLSRPLFHFRNGMPLTGKEVSSDPSLSPQVAGLQPVPLQHPQLSDWGSHCCCQGWHVILHHHGAWPLAQCCLPLLRPSSSGPHLHCCSDGKGSLTELVCTHLSPHLHSLTHMNGQKTNLPRVWPVCTISRGGLKGVYLGAILGGALWACPYKAG